MSDPLPLPIETAVLKVRKTKRSERTLVVNRILKSSIIVQDLEKPEMKLLLHRRALFLTELRERGIWP